MCHALDLEQLTFILSFVPCPPDNHLLPTQQLLERESYWKRTLEQRNSKPKIKTDLYKALYLSYCPCHCFSLLKTTQGPAETFLLILIWLHLPSLPRLVSLNIYRVPHTARCYVTLSYTWGQCLKVPMYNIVNVEGKKALRIKSHLCHFASVSLF